MPTPLFEEIVELFEHRGAEPYLTDVVTQKEHALQAAALAEAEGAPDPLVIAALLHDLGQMLRPGGDREPDVDDRHEHIGQQWLSRYFSSDVTEPIRLHVEAKRYLCAVDPTYIEQLSSESLHSLRVQGGPQSRKEIRDFQHNPYHRDAVRLRAIDDQAKTPGLWVPGFDHDRDRFEAALLTKYLGTETPHFSPPHPVYSPA